MIGGEAPRESSVGVQRVSNFVSIVDSVLLRCNVLVFVVLGLHVVAASNNRTEKDTTNFDSSTFFERLIIGTAALTFADYVKFLTFFLCALELLTILVYRSGIWFDMKHIPVRGKHLDYLTTKDLAFIGFNKVSTAPFIYFFFQFAYSESNILWGTQDMSLKTVLLPLPVIYIIYDFFYTILHWFLHVKWIYGYIHKHHHVQKAPSRANHDAVNVHPIEFFLGEYNHIFATYLCCRLGMELHVLAIFIFVVVGGALAGYNHTRYDLVFSFFGVTIYDSKVHDVHHRIPQSNYGQYIMLWDKLFGSYRPYDANDRVNPSAQLDPKTGKSYNCAKESKVQ